MSSINELYDSQTHYIFIGNTYEKSNFLPGVYTDLLNYLMLIVRYYKIDSNKLLEIITKIDSSLEYVKIDLAKNLILDKFKLLRMINDEKHNVHKSEKIDKKYIEYLKYYSCYFKLEKTNLMFRLKHRVKFLKEETNIKTIIIIISGHGYENGNDNIKTFGGFSSYDGEKIQLAELFNLYKDFNQYYFVDTCRYNSDSDISINKAVETSSYHTDNELAVIYPIAKYTLTNDNIISGGSLINPLIKILNEYDDIKYTSTIKLFEIIAKLMIDDNKNKTLKVYLNSKIRQDKYLEIIDYMSNLTKQDNRSVRATIRNHK